MGELIKSSKPSISEIANPRLFLRTQNLGVKYEIGPKREDMMSRTFAAILRRKEKGIFWALKDISLTGFSGDIIGIIGSNGAGKTTLCRVISGLLSADEGNVEVNSYITALLSLGTGFNNQLTGRENIFLNGMMLGFTKKHINSLSAQIIDFSGIGKFIDQPLKFYSSGMRSRLGFSIASMVEPEIVVIDEALNAGDLAFAQKASHKIQELVEKASMVIVVTHQLNFIEQCCTRAVWIDKGRAKLDGLPGEVVKGYKAAKKISNVRIFAGFRTTPRNAYLNDIRSQPIIKVQNLGIKYMLKKRKTTDSNKSNCFNEATKKRERYFWSLKDINFSAKEGEIIGIIGPNGAGKTTLCRVLSGILKPDTGTVLIHGEITTLLSIGAGFNMQLPGKDNILMNGMIMGVSKKKLKKLYSNIVDFSELSKFIEEPLKNYSNGMKVRLGFSIATMLKPDIFIVDEALSAGDASFRERASEKIQENIHDAKAVVVVTHELNFVETVCTRAIWIEEGLIKFDGDPKDAVAKYRKKTIS